MKNQEAARLQREETWTPATISPAPGSSSSRESSLDPTSGSVIVQAASAASVLSTRSPRQIIIQRRDEGFGFTLRHFIVYPPEVRVLFEKLIFRWTTFIENSVIFSHLKPPKKKNPITNSCSAQDKLENSCLLLFFQGGFSSSEIVVWINLKPSWQKNNKYKFPRNQLFVSHGEASSLLAIYFINTVMSKVSRKNFDCGTKALICQLSSYSTSYNLFWAMHANLIWNKNFVFDRLPLTRGQVQIFTF